ncbi:MAG: GDP-L-fucose synthase [Pseudomonadota bacterium]
MARIYLAGHTGMVGGAILRQLQAQGTHEILTRTSRALNLMDQAAVRDFFQRERPDAVILAAARVGGILANNSYPGQFIYENLMIQSNVIHQAHEAGVTRLLQLGSSCIYPRHAPQPMTEDALLTGVLEPTNEPYAIAKIAGLKLCESANRQFGADYRCIMPTNLYGPGDNFHPMDSHVLPALMLRFHEAAQNGAEKVVVWGSGTPRREFLHVDDAAAAALFVLDLDKTEFQEGVGEGRCHINVGTGTDVTIRELAELLADVTGYAGGLEFDPTMPDGTPRKVLDVSRMSKLGWSAKAGLKEGVRETYDWFRRQDADQLRI